MPAMSGLLTSVSDAFAFARTRSVLSVRTSMIVMFDPASDFLQTLVTLLRVCSIEHADEDHDLAALRQCFFKQIAGLSSGRDVVSADITHAITVWRVAVLRHDQCLLGDAIEHLCLVRRIDGTDRDPVNTSREQIVDEALLFGGGSVGWNFELHFDVGNLFGRLLGSFTSDDPEVGCIVCNKCEFVFTSGSAARIRGCVRVRRRGLATGPELK